MVPHDVMEEIGYMCLIEGKENQQLVWKIILMTAKEVWNMLIWCASVDEGKSDEIGSNQPSIKEKRSWRRQLCALRINGEMNDYETKDIVKVILRQIKSQKKEQQSNWIKGKNPQEFEENRKHVVEVWFLGKR